MEDLVKADVSADKADPRQKHLENLRQIEGIYYAWCEIHNNQDWSMFCDGHTIWFGDTDNTIGTGRMNRDALEEMSITELAQFIVMHLNKLCLKNKFPSLHQWGDKVMVSFVAKWHQAASYNMSGKVIGVHFYNDKVKYDIEIKIYDEPPTRIYNIDSKFVHRIIEATREVSRVDKQDDEQMPQKTEGYPLYDDDVEDGRYSGSKLASEDGSF